MSPAWHHECRSLRLLQHRELRLRWKLSRSQIPPGNSSRTIQDTILQGIRNGRRYLYLFQFLTPGIFFYVPVSAAVSESLLQSAWSGCYPVSRASITHLLSKSGKGNAVVIVIGGAAESLSSSPGANTVLVKQRKGFVRMALEFGWECTLCHTLSHLARQLWSPARRTHQCNLLTMMCHRADLVPVYSFGENELFKQVIFSEGSFGRRLQDLFKKIVGFAPCLFVGDRLPVMPYRIPITTVGEFVIILQPVALCKRQLSFFFFFFKCRPLSFFSGRSNRRATAYKSHRGGGGPLSQTLHGWPVKVIPWT